MDVTANCAICSAPPQSNCLCENERLQLALKQSEQRTMDRNLLKIRDWVLRHARHHILTAFARLKTIRKEAQTAYLNSLPYYNIYMHYSGTPPIPREYVQQLHMQITESHAEFQRGVDRDWRAAVLRYPEVLDYFYNLVELRLPSDSSSRVAEPPFAIAGYEDRGYAASEVSRVGSSGKRKKKTRDAPQISYPPTDYLIKMPPPVPTPPDQQDGHHQPPYGVYYR